MAVGDNIGALGGLGSLTEDEFSDLSKGLQSTNNPIASVFGYDITPQTALSTAIGYGAKALANTSIPSLALTALDAKKSYDLNQLSNKAMGRPTDVLSGFSKKSLTDLKNEIDVNKDRNITQREVQNYGMSKGRTSYNVGLNPMAGYQPNAIDIQGLAGFGKSTPSTGIVNAMEAPSSNVDKFGFSLTPNTYTTQQAQGISQGISQGVTGLGGGKGGSYSGVTDFSPTEGVDTSDPESTGSTGVGVSNTGYADDAQSSGTGGGESTYICTALYEMGDMKKYIYKYDQVYGKRVDPNIYRGYCLWGKYVATKMRDKGIVYKIIKPIALAWAKQMAFDLSKGRYGKKNKVVKVVSRIGEGICYGLGFVANLKIKKGVKYG
jgi:hypothetical protein